MQLGAFMTVDPPLNPIAFDALGSSASRHAGSDGSAATDLPVTVGAEPNMAPRKTFCGCVITTSQ